jgi:GDP-4-dehydro-6-deoxy-D-mannose reductase
VNPVRVLVTGSDGFVGHTLVPRLTAAGHEVWGVDRARGPSAVAAERHIVADLTKADEVVSALDRSRPQWIVHLAAQASVRASFDEPIPTLLNNTLPTLHILDWIRGTGRGVRLLAIGSAEEYGVVAPDALPLGEGAPVNPSSPYALAKSIQNQACRAYATLYDVDVVCTRSFNHTGAGQRDAFVLPSFARQMCEMKAGLRESVLEVGNLDVRRDFLDVRDVCAAYEALLERGERGETYNVCSGQSHRLHDLVERLSELVGVDVEIRVDPQRLRPVDMPELRGDATRIEAVTGWRPTIQMDDTLRSLLDYWTGRVIDETSNRRTE